MPTLSYALFHPIVRDRTNAYLKTSGYALVLDESGEKPFLSVKTLHNDKEVGIRLTPSPIASPNKNLTYNRIKAWTNFEHPEDQKGGDAILKTIAQAEEQAHDHVNGASKPNIKASEPPRTKVRGFRVPFSFSACVAFLSK